MLLVLAEDVSVSFFEKGLTGVDQSLEIVVDTCRWVELESPVCEREGDNWLKVPAQDRLCSGVSRSLAVSATDLGVMGGHHRQQRLSSCAETNTERENYMLILFVFSELRCSHLGKD